MSKDLLQEIIQSLSEKNRAELQVMADRLKSKKVSFSLLYHLSRGNYPSVPTYDRVTAIANDLNRTNRRKAPARPS